MTKIVRLDKDWWKEEREPSSELIIKKKKKLADKYYSLAQIAKRFECGYDLLYKAIRKNELESVVVGRSYRVTEDAVIRFLELCQSKKRVG